MKQVIFGLLAMLVATSAFALDLQVTNKSSTSIHQLYIGHSTSADWGQDQLEKGTVEPGAQFSLTDIPAGTYDVRVVAEDGTDCVVMGANFNESKEWTITEAMLDGCAK